MPTILIADDESSIRTILARAMENKGYAVVKAANGLEALDQLKSQYIDVAIVDIRMPELSGLDLLNKKTEFLGSPSFFVITAQDTMENAVEAMKRGAVDYLTKPFDLTEVALLVERAIEDKKNREELALLKSEVPRTSDNLLVGKNKAMLAVFKIIGKVANQDVTVLIEGESGTGKEMVAKAVHYQGSRALKPFLAVNCSAIPDNLLESELFGYRKGAFTGANFDRAGYFERAHGGTLFLDEIGDMPPLLQAKLLRVLQEKEVQRLGDTRAIPVNVRIIAATNQNLEERVRRGQFREDLYFRLKVVPVYLPALRERRDDIPLLVDHFLKKCSDDFKAQGKKISLEAMDYLKNRDWPGNIRELENLVKRVFVLAQGSILEVADFEALSLNLGLSKDRQFPKIEMLESFINGALASFVETIDEESQNDLLAQMLPLLERPLLRLVLQKCKNNQIKASKVLGINRNTLRKKIRDLKIDRRKTPRD